MNPENKIAELKSQAIKNIQETELDKTIIFIGSATCENAAGAQDVKNKFEALLKENNLTDQVLIKLTGCTGFCADEPIIQIKNKISNAVYKKITIEKVKDLVEKHLIKGEVIQEWLV